MLSIGTELFLAFWTASKSVGLPARSPPPVRAATSMFLMSLANSLPRLASITAFLCLVVAHLECPDIPLLLLHDCDEELVHPRIARDLGVEGGGEQRSLTYCDDSTCVFARARGGGRVRGPGRRSGHRGAPVAGACQDLDPGAGLLDPGGADERGGHGPAADARHLDGRLERVD